MSKPQLVRMQQKKDMKLLLESNNNWLKPKNNTIRKSPKKRLKKLLRRRRKKRPLNRLHSKLQKSPVSYLQVVSKIFFKLESVRLQLVVF